MSNRTLIVAILVALGLGLVTLLVVRNRAPGATQAGVAAGDRLLEVDAAAIRAVLIKPAGAAGAPGPATLVERTAGGAWRLSIPTMPVEPGRERPSWAVDPERLRALLGVLRTVTATGKPEPGASLGSDAAVVTLTLDGGAQITLRLAARTLGGQGLVEITSPPANVPAPAAAPAAAPTGDKPVTRLALTTDALHRLFQGDGPRAWRDTRIMPGVMADASRIRLISDKGSIALSKAGGRWDLTEPLGAPAEPSIVQSLLQTFESLHIARFFDEQPPALSATRLDTPYARVIIESDTREMGAADAARIVTSRRELAIGDGLDPAGRQRYASTDGGATVVAIDGAPLADIDVSPARYIARAASPAAPADVGLLMFQAVPVAGTPQPGEPLPPVSMGFLRRVDGWVELRSDGTQVLQDPKRADSITQLIRFVTTEPSALVSLSEPSGYQPLGTLSIRTSGDAPLDEVEVGRHAASGIAIRAGRVFRTYSATPDLFQVALGPITPNAGVGADGQPPRDITK